MKFHIRLLSAPFFAFTAALVILGSPHPLRAETLPPAVMVDGNIWSGSAGNYSGPMYWQGISTSGAIYVSGGAATLSGAVWKEGYYAGGYVDDGNGGQQWDPNTNWVGPNYYPFSVSGTYSRGIFSIPDVGVTSVDTGGNQWPPFPQGASTGSPISGGPPELWVNGSIFYRFSSGADYYYSFDYYDWIVVNSGSVSSSDGLNVSGSYTPNDGGGIFLMSSPTVDLRPAAMNGSLLATNTQPSFGPPHVAVNGVQWTFQGNTGGLDYYMCASGPRQRLTIDSNQNVTLNDPATGVVNAHGYYNDGVFQELPEPVRALDASGAVLQFAAQGPASVVVNGVAWFQSDIGGTAYNAYFGALSGQELYLNGHAFWVSDPYHNVNTTGTYASGAFQAAGAGVQVQAGDAGGTVVPITPQARTQNVATDATVNGSLDIHGNLFSLGAWQSDPTTAGYSLSFTDRPSGGTDGVATICQVANRAANQWLWSHATADFASTMPMMKLDDGNRLTLYSPADATPRIVLDPQMAVFNGAVKIQGRVRIQPQGDLGMGGFVNEPAP